MEVELTPDQQAFVRQAIGSGRIQREEEAVCEALSLWEERERKRAEFVASLEDAKASVAQGEERVVTQDSMQELADEVYVPSSEGAKAISQAEYKARPSK